MSSWWNGRLKRRAGRASAVSLLALGLVAQASLPVLPGSMPPAYAVDAPAVEVLTSGSTIPALPKTDQDAQLDVFQKAIDARTLSEADFQKLLELTNQNPTNYRAHLLLGLGFGLQGLDDQAVEQFRMADKYGPNDPEAIFQILTSMFAKGAGSAANELLKSAMQRFPDNPKVLYILGKRLKENKHYSQAGKVLMQAYRTGAKIQGLPTELGDLIAGQEPQKAVYLAKLDLVGNPDYAPALILLARGYMNMGNYELALPSLERLYKQSPSHEETSEMYVRSLFWCGDFKKAIEPAFFVLRANSGYVVSDLRSASTLNNIMAHLSPTQSSAALQSFYDKTDRDKIPVPPPFHFFVGRIFFRQHHLAQAKAELLRYCDADPKNGETLWMLGNIEENLDHNYQSALSYYRLAHALLPYNATITNATLSLEERLTSVNNDWARSLRDWFYSSLSPGKH